MFSAARADQSLLSTKKNGYKTATERLGICGQALRTLVTHGISRLKINTVRAVIDHITQTLPDRDGHFCQPLVKSYLETFAILLGSHVHVETLASVNGEKWVSCVDFILDRMSYLLEGANSSVTGLVLMSRDSPGPGTPGQASIAYSNGRPPASSQRSQAQSQQHELLSLTQALLSLISASNAPYILRCRQISDAILQVLRQRINFGSLHRVAFGILNCILLKTAGDDPSLGSTITKQVVPLLSYWWLPRAIDTDEMLLSVKDEMLMTMHGIHLHLDHLLQESPVGALLGELEDLLDNLWTEYSQRSSQTRLRLEDIMFSSLVVPNGHFRTDLFTLRPFNQDAERRWALLDNMSLLESIFLRHTGADLQRLDTQDEQPRKKQRLAGSSHRLHQKMITSNAAVKLTALQLTSFLLPRSGASEIDIVATVDDLIPIISDKQGALSSWAMIACARYVVKSLSQSSFNSFRTQLCDSTPSKIRGGGI